MKLSRFSRRRLMLAWFTDRLDAFLFSLKVRKLLDRACVRLRVGWTAGDWASLPEHRPIDQLDLDVCDVCALGAINWVVTGDPRNRHFSLVDDSEIDPRESDVAWVAEYAVLKFIERAGLTYEDDRPIVSVEAMNDFAAEDVNDVIRWLKRSKRYAYAASLRFQREEAEMLKHEVLRFEKELSRV
jgi:hypothetical protein